MQSCTLSFDQTNSTNVGPYAVQLVMEDFPLQQITLSSVSGFQETKTTSQAISKIPLQFVLYGKSFSFNIQMSQPQSFYILK